MVPKTYKLKGLIAIILIFHIAINVSAQKPVIEWEDIPGGNFIMGSPTSEPGRQDNETQHKVILSDYKIGKYEITISQFKAFIDATGYLTDAEKGSGGTVGSVIWNGTEFVYQANVNWKYNEMGNLRPSAEYNFPVVHVSWNDAKAFADWMDCRLPTEAEWEYACRVGTTTPFYTGNNLKTSQSNFDGTLSYNKNAKGDFRRKVLCVGSLTPNEWGLYDMHGNVCEWCSDWYSDYSTEVQTNPTGPASGMRKVTRGGGWIYNAGRCRSADRGSEFPAHRCCYRGFRLVSSNNIDKNKIIENRNIEQKLENSAHTTNKLDARIATIEWASVPAGTFLMGSPKSEADRKENEVQHTVTLNACIMSVYEVTVKQFKAFIDSTGYITDAEKGAGGYSGSVIWTGSKMEVKEGVNWKYDEKGNLRPTNEFNHPVIHVSWNDAKAFADWMGCRLPTEAEWEYACRGGSTTPFSTGANLATSQANYNGNSPYSNNPKGEYREKTMPVGSFMPNDWGLYDMHGNVREWCNDWYGEYTAEAQTNPKGPDWRSSRVIRGGSWHHSARKCRSADRYDDLPNYRCNDLGFRIVFLENP